MFNKRNKITFKADNTYNVIALFFTRSFNLWKEKTFSNNLEIGKRCDVRKRKIMWGLTLSHGLLHAFCKRKEGNLHNYCSKMKLYGVSSSYIVFMFFLNLCMKYHFIISVTAVTVLVSFSLVDGHDKSAVQQLRARGTNYPAKLFQFASCPKEKQHLPKYTQCNK